MVVSNATPLIALDAVALDTETTGLDPTDARLVEVGAIRVKRGRISSQDSFHRLVAPGIPIPASATAIHHIDDTRVAGAPAFAEVWTALKDFIGDSIVIGHSVGFDLAVLQGECRRASLPFDSPRTLDTRLLSEVAEPALASHSIESLAAWLKIQLTDRHSASGDALTAARIFIALLPKLRECGIRTVGEATLACRGLTKLRDEQSRAGWVDALDSPARGDARRTLAQIDTYPYRHRIRDVMSTPAQFVAGHTSVAKALQLLMQRQISSVYVRPNDEDGQPPSTSGIGIVTERDVLRAVAMHGRDALEMPVAKLMSTPLAAVPADDFIYRAIGRMSRLGIRHLGVTDENGNIIGALSARNLLRLRAGEAVSLGDEIDHASDIPELAEAWAKLPHVAASLLVEGVGAREVAAVISGEVGAATRQAAVLAERRMIDEGHGRAPCAYSLAVLGSAGRGESLLAMDQDNALLFAEGAEAGSEAWFAKLGSHVADILHEIGVPYCKGGVMANNPDWRGSLTTWGDRINRWIRVSKPEHLMSVDIFFDMRPVHGESRLGIEIWRHAFDAAHGDVGFAKLLADAAGGVEPAIGLFGRFRSRQGRLDLKKGGLFGLVSATRALAVCHHVVERSTHARLLGLKALGIGGAHDLEALAEAQETFLRLLLAQQLEDIERGVPPSNTIEVKNLSSRDSSRLRAALQAVRQLDDLKRDLLFSN